MRSTNLGISKKSFTIYFKGGEIWIEHLDAIDNINDIRDKFRMDMLQIDRVSTSSYIAINLDESRVNEEILDYILNGLRNAKKDFRKIVFVGLDSKMKKYIKSQQKELKFVVGCINDFEKAKEWLF